MSGLARRTDPVTSLEAGLAMEHSGMRETHQMMVLALVRANPGLTSAELALRSTLERHEVARRLSDLANRNLVERGTPRRCRTNNRRAVTWRAL